MAFVAAEIRRLAAYTSAAVGACTFAAAFETAAEKAAAEKVGKAAAFEA